MSGELIDSLRQENARLRAALEAAAGAPGSTCTRAEDIPDVEWTRRQWRNAIDQWKFWHEAYIADIGQPEFEGTWRIWRERALRAEALTAGRVLDEHVHAVYAEAFVMAEAVRRFLARVTTRQVIDAGLLDRDVVRDLVEANDRMWLARTQRIGAARGAVGSTEAPGPAMDG